MKLIATLILAALAAGPAAAAAVAADPIYVIRHLQKAQGDDPSLTDEGRRNAEALASMLAEKNIVAVFATPTRRAMETGEPLAKRLGIAVTPYDPRDADALVAAVAAANGPVLVVGHSNTVPDLVARFGGPRPAAIDEDSYGTLFLVGAGGKVTTLELR